MGKEKDIDMEGKNGAVVDINGTCMTAFTCTSAPGLSGISGDVICGRFGSAEAKTTGDHEG